MADRRFPRALFRSGTEPDPRFSLANERTFLAWIRTGLALLAAGVALETLGLSIHPALRLSASLLLLIAGLLVPAQAWLGWIRTERALRLRVPLPAPTFGLPLSIVLGIAGILVFVGVVVEP